MPALQLGNVLLMLCPGSKDDAGEEGTGPYIPPGQHASIMGSHRPCLYLEDLNIAVNIARLACWGRGDGRGSFCCKEDPCGGSEVMEEVRDAGRTNSRGQNRLQRLIA